MKQFTQEEIFKRYAELPQEVKDAIFAEATAEKMNEIGKKHGLLIDKIGNLAREAGYVMLGLEHPNDFVSNLVSTLEVPELKAREIASDINEAIFKPIRSHLMAATNDQKTSPAPSASSFAARPPSFAINPMGSGADMERKNQNPASIPSMIFPSQNQSAQSSVKAGNEHSIPPAPKFEKSAQNASSDPYREPIS